MKTFVAKAVFFKVLNSRRRGHDDVSRYLSGFVAAALAAVTLTAAAATIDTTKSQLTATFRQMNVPVEGRFGVFNGAVDFDPKNIAASRARIEIDTASFDVGAPEYNDELRKKEWFDTSAYPKATFVSSSVSAAGQNRFEVKGKFTLKGKTQEIAVSLARRTVGGVQVYEGELPISRKAFALGSAEWGDTLEDKVIVKFRIATAVK